MMAQTDIEYDHGVLMMQLVDAIRIVPYDYPKHLI